MKYWSNEFGVKNKLKYLIHPYYIERSKDMQKKIIEQHLKYSLPSIWIGHIDGVVIRVQV